MAEWRRKMSAAEFMDWQAYLRRKPLGHSWENWCFAMLAREIDKGRPRGKNKKLPNLDHYMWKPAEPLYSQRLKKEAKRKK